jgi:hypothetical protein
VLLSNWIKLISVILACTLNIRAKVKAQELTTRNEELTNSLQEAKAEIARMGKREREQMGLLADANTKSNNLDVHRQSLKHDLEEVRQRTLVDEERVRATMAQYENQLSTLKTQVSNLKNSKLHAKREANATIADIKSKCDSTVKQMKQQFTPNLRACKGRVEAHSAQLLEQLNLSKTPDDYKYSVVRDLSSLLEQTLLEKAPEEPVTPEPSAPATLSLERGINKAIGELSVHKQAACIQSYLESRTKYCKGKYANVWRQLIPLNLIDKIETECLKRNVSRMEQTNWSVDRMLRVKFICKLSRRKYETLRRIMCGRDMSSPISLEHDVIPPRMPSWGKLQKAVAAVEREFNFTVVDSEGLAYVPLGNMLTKALESCVQKGTLSWVDRNGTPKLEDAEGNLPVVNFQLDACYADAGVHLTSFCFTIANGYHLSQSAAAVKRFAITLKNDHWEEIAGLKDTIFKAMSHAITNGAEVDGRSVELLTFFTLDAAAANTMVGIGTCTAEYPCFLCEVSTKDNPGVWHKTEGTPRTFVRQRMLAHACAGKCTACDKIITTPATHTDIMPPGYESAHAGTKLGHGMMVPVDPCTCFLPDVLHTCVRLTGALAKVSVFERIVSENMAEEINELFQRNHLHVPKVQTPKLQERVWWESITSFSYNFEACFKLCVLFPALLRIVNKGNSIVAKKRIESDTILWNLWCKDYWPTLCGNHEEGPSKSREEQAQRLSAIGLAFVDAFKLGYGARKFLYPHIICVHIPQAIRACPISLLRMQTQGIERGHSFLKSMLKLCNRSKGGIQGKSMLAQLFSHSLLYDFVNEEALKGLSKAELNVLQSHSAQVAKTCSTNLKTQIKQISERVQKLIAGRDSEDEAEASTDSDQSEY